MRGARAIAWVLMGSAALAGTALGAGAPEAGAGAGATEAMARFAFEVGQSARLGALRDERLLSGCADLPECARGCEHALRAIADGAEPRGPECRQLPPGASVDAARALVRRRLSEASRRAAALDPRSREALECGLGRLGVAAARPEACAREEARILAAALGDAPPGPGPRATTFLLEVCVELESCSGSCAEDLRAAANVDWSRSDAAAVARGAAAGACPELTAAIQGGPPPGARERVAAWGIGRLRAFAGAGCPGLDPGRQAMIACGLARAGAEPVASCGTAACPSVPAPRRRSGADGR